MESELRRILRQHSRSLTDRLAAQLTSRSTSRYRELDPRVLSVRCRLLAEALIRSTHQGSEHLGEFVATIARGRLAEGFELEDLQAALRILEVRAWLIVARESTPDSLRANLTALNTTIGYARDELARAFRAHACAAASHTRRVRLEVKELFQGTEAAPLTSAS
jgi:hypothetical protein